MLALCADCTNPGSLWGSANAAKARVAEKKRVDQRDISDKRFLREMVPVPQCQRVTPSV
jgi:hypothetical protein